MRVTRACPRSIRAATSAKLIEAGYDLQFGRATFTLSSRYERAARELARYGSSIDEYVEWLEAMHRAIGAVQGYAMTARLEGDRLVETYRDLPNREGLEPAPDLPVHQLSPEEIRRYEGIYTGTRAGDTASVEYTMRVWQENGRLRVSTWRTGHREAYGRHLVPVAEDTFLPGWYPGAGPPEVPENARVRFSSPGSGSALRVELEVTGGGATTVWRLDRRP